MLSLLTCSCSSRRSKLDRKHLIPEKELVSILTDTYITDALVAMPRIVVKFTNIDSLSTYNYIIEKHGYTKAELDKTLKYYFVKNPKKLIKIYDKVLGILSEMESRIEKEIAKNKVHPAGIWKGHDYFYFSSASETDSAKFDIVLKNPGNYILSETVTLFPDDQAFNPGLTAYSINADSIETGKRNYIKTPRYIKDGKPHTYTVIFKVPIKTTLQIRGSLFDFENHPDDMVNNTVIKNIAITHTVGAL